MQVNRRFGALEGSATLALAARAKALAAAGADVISMAVGEPDFPAPVRARDAAKAMLDTGEVRYTPAPGTAGLRRTLAQHLAATRGGTWTPDQVVVQHSCKHALSSVLAVLLEPDDEVLVFDPVWNSYEAAITIAGGRAVHVPPGPELVPDLAAAAAAVTPRTRGVMLNSPSNPSGHVWSREQVEGLVALAEEHDLWIVSDEIYRRLVHEGDPAVSPVSLSDAARARTVVVDGASKSFAMTGFRIGFAAGPEPVIRALGNLQSETTGCPNAVSQAAYEAVLVEPEPPEVAVMAAEFDRRRRLLLAGLERIGVPTPRPRGAFYAFPNVSRFLDEQGVTGFCEDLLEREHLAIVPGGVFGMDQHVRLSYALSAERLEEALGRLERFLSTRG